MIKQVYWPIRMYRYLIALLFWRRVLCVKFVGQYRSSIVNIVNIVIVLVVTISPSLFFGPNRYRFTYDVRVRIGIPLVEHIHF